MIKVIQAYRYAVEPTAAQQAALRSHCGAQRFAFNWGLELVRANLAQRAAEVSYGVDVDALTPALPWSAYAMRKLWNRVRALSPQCPVPEVQGEARKAVLPIHHWRIRLDH
jgi:putative transposase